MAIKAKKLGTEKGIKKSLAGGSSKFATRATEEGIEVRFLTEPEEWFEAAIHYGDKTSFPCSEGDCLGCEEGMDEGRKHYANVYLVDEDRVAVLEMAKGVAADVVRKYERNNTIMDRNFEITREGTGKQTRYYTEALDKSRMKGVDDLALIDLMSFMEEWLERALKEEAGEEEVSASGRRHTKKSTKRRRPIEDDDIEDDDEDMDDDDEDDEDEAPARRKRPAARSTATKKRPMKRRSRS